MNRTILIVDDSSSLRTVVRLALQRAGYRVEAGDGQQALSVLEGLARSTSWSAT
jgi:two-component system, chemotaxis family, chemotaxis protein CheY